MLVSSLHTSSEQDTQYGGISQAPHAVLNQQNSNLSSIPYVKYTLQLSSNILINGASDTPWVNYARVNSIAMSISSEYYLFVGMTPERGLTAGSILVINLTTSKIVNNVTLANVDPYELFYDQFNGYLYVANGFAYSDQVLAYNVSDLLTKSVIYHPVQTINTGFVSGPFATLDTSNGDLYLSGGDNYVVQITPSNNISYIYFNVPLYGSTGIFYDPASGYVYDWLSYWNVNGTTGIITPGSLIRIMNTSNGTFFRYVSLNDSYVGAIELDPINDELYIMNETGTSLQNASVLVMNSSLGEVEPPIKIKSEGSTFVGYSLEFNPLDSDFFVFYSGDFANSHGQATSSNFGLSVINGSTNSLILNTSIASFTDGGYTTLSNSVYNPVNGYFYLLANTGNVWIVETEQTYKVTVTQIGLPNVYPWSIVVDGYNYYGLGSANLFSFPNGTFNYSVISPTDYSTSYKGTITVNGTNVSIEVMFVRVSEITFSESGLPSGTYWSITLNGTTESSTFPSVVFTEPNGTYGYTVSNPISGGPGVRYETVASGSVVVKGSDLTINTSFTTQCYLAIASNPSTGGSTSPPSGWFNSSSTVEIYANSNSGFAFQFWKGSGSGNYTGTEASHSITIDSPITEVANFGKLYSVSITENGLPTGITWYVNLTNGQTSLSTNSSINFSLPNGTYDFTIAVNNKEYSPSALTGRIVVNGASVDESITFTEVVYLVTFSEKGLPSGTSWSVTLLNTTKSSTNETIIFTEPNGTYSYVIHLPSGYTSESSSLKGSLTLTGVTSTFSIKAQQIPGYLFYIIIIVVIVAVIGVSFVLLRKRK